MEAENGQKTILYMNGNFLGPIKDVQITTLKPESSDESRFLGIDLAQGGDFTGTFTLKLPHVSRKRFVRNLVKAGCPKKKAKEIAWRVRTSYSYANFLARTAGWQNVW